MGVRREPDLKISEEAGVWLHRLQVEDTPEVRAAFDAWIRRGAGHLQEFLFAQAIWKELDHLDAQTRARLELDESTAVVEFPQRGDSVATVLEPRRRHPWVAAAAIAILMLGTVSIMVLNAGARTYVTDVGEQKSLKLPDGSVIHLNTRSRVEVDFSERQRLVRLVTGEALFKVQRDVQRPFQVLTDNAQIRVLGTEFNVYRNDGSATRVAVLEGAVQVSSGQHGGMLELKAGDEADIRRERVARVKEPSIERAVSWRARRLMFPGNPIGEIAVEFNRYNETPIRIEGADLLKRRMSGVFDADDPSPLLQYLERDPTIEIVRGDEIVIRARAENAEASKP